MVRDLDRLQGTWHVTSIEADGQTLAAAASDGAKIVIKGSLFISLSMGATYEGTVDIHQTRKPKSLDLVFTAGPEKGNRNLGIYKLDGDRWTLCLATRGSTRPKTFATKPGTGFALEMLERDNGVRSRAKEPSPSKRASATRRRALDQAATSGVPTELEGEWTMVSGVFSGKALDAAMVTWCTRIMRGNVTTVVAGPQTMLKAVFALDTSTNPHAIEYENLEGASKGKRQSGIFKLTGATLKICVSAPGKPRPADFSSKAGDGRSYTTWRRGRSRRRVH